MVKLLSLALAIGLSAVTANGMNFEKKYTLTTEFGFPVDVSVVTTDLDNDGKIDMLLGSPAGILRAEMEKDRFESKGLIYKFENNKNPNMRVGIDVGDFNQDGLKDVAYATPEGVRILENIGNNKFKDLGYVIKNDNMFVSADVHVADVNKDGKDDIIYATSSETQIWLNK
ncbi:MAG: VCBS repeat-containing protein [Nanoarchaeota archaeon]|nr:VCBS repeat-containing protein [Nanoarchaeota archaeon]MBU4351803.1 VCBS repeat-containing protein [Nanoarchaeota archaeon]MBU4456198.1 VCBS repeat-containing protein [Nanoarchaeota archaeon]MCG2719404.1 VCBS repeat-containing protein [Nanoarchaeota archaeon]